MCALAPSMGQPRRHMEHIEGPSGSSPPCRECCSPSRGDLSLTDHVILEWQFELQEEMIRRNKFQKAVPSFDLSSHRQVGFWFCTLVLLVRFGLSLMLSLYAVFTPYNNILTEIAPTSHTDNTDDIFICILLFSYYF